MNLSKREFMQVLAAASVGGMGLARWSQADASKHFKIARGEALTMRRRQTSPEKG